MPKVKVVGAKLALDAAPVPVRLTVCAAGGVIGDGNGAGRLPVTVGVKVTLMEQLAPAATEVAQVLVWAYGALATMLVMVSDAVPELVSVTDCAALVVFTF